MSPEMILHSDRVHLLEWYAAYCITVAENCARPDVSRMLRQLSVDLALEAHKCRAKCCGRLELQQRANIVSGEIFGHDGDHAAAAEASPKK